MEKNLINMRLQGNPLVKNLNKLYKEVLKLNIGLEFLRTDVCILILVIIVLVLFMLYIISINNLRKLRKNYSAFIKKLGNGNNIEEVLKEYIKRVEKVEEKNEEIINYCKGLDDNIKICIKKIGIVRYNAFKDTGSDLSFALALLNENNNGIVLNGIYARDSSNIYAKPIEKGESKYVLSNEEKEAINRAINNR